MVIAGAGSGKTRVLTRRIAHLISQRVPARGILAVTFTNKAAAEMKQRVESLCGPQPELWIGTFHSMCARLLRLEISKLGMQSNFTIVDDQDQLTVLKECLETLKLDSKVYRPRSLREQIGRAKNRLLTPAGVKEEGSDRSTDIIASVYQEYQKKLFANNALDFDDLLMASVTLLRKDAATLEKYRKKFHHVLIDEYQDTNHAQYILVRLLTGKFGNVFAVGDEDQSIYSFRGAQIHNILDFERDFPSAVIYRLQQNYRSTQNILAAANALIRNNRQRKGKTLWTQNDPGEKGTVYYGNDEREEVDFILDSVESLQSAGEVTLKEIVIFYRIHALSRVLEEGLRRRGIPYGIIGGVGFYERREIKDALAYLRILCSPNDSISLKRIANVPSRGIGKTTLAALGEMADAQNIPLSRAMESAVARGDIGAKASQGISKLLGLMRKGARDHCALGVTGTLAWVLEESGYLADLRRENTIEAKTRLENLKELSSATEEFEESSPGAPLEHFLSGVSLWTDLDRYQETQEKLTMMSLHSSKGLEFSCVFIAGLEEGIFPYSYWGSDRADMEEERRLLYVGMTRAQKRLFLTCARSRMLFGSRKSFDASRFLAEIEGDYVLRQGNRFSPRSLYDDYNQDIPEVVAIPERPLAALAIPGVVTIDFNEGEKIQHPKFGAGRILTCFDEGENRKVSIQFQSEMHPRLLAVKYANLKKVMS